MNSARPLKETREKLLRYLAEAQERSEMPTVVEMAQQMEWSIGTVRHHLNVLEAHGHIRRSMTGKLEVLHDPLSWL